MTPPFDHIQGGKGKGPRYRVNDTLNLCLTCLLENIDLGFKNQCYIKGPKIAL